MSLRYLNFSLAGIILSRIAQSFGAIVAVNANGVIFDGTARQAINVAGSISITFSVSAGATVMVNGGTLDDADGIGSLSGEISAGGASISGISSPTAGFAAGVFEGSRIGMTTPAALNFIIISTSFR